VWRYEMRFNLILRVGGSTFAIFLEFRRCLHPKICAGVLFEARPYFYVRV